MESGDRGNVFQRLRGHEILAHVDVGDGVNDRAAEIRIACVPHKRSALRVIVCLIQLVFFGGRLGQPDQRMPSPAQVPLHLACLQDSDSVSADVVRPGVVIHEIDPFPQLERDGCGLVRENFVYGRLVVPAAGCQREGRAGCERHGCHARCRLCFSCLHHSFVFWFLYHLLKNLCPSP